MSEAHGFRFHHPVDDRAALLAGAEAVPEVLPRGDHERRLVIVVERTETEEVLAVASEFDPPRLGEPLDRDFPFQPLELVCWDSRQIGLLAGPLSTAILILDSDRMIVCIKYLRQGDIRTTALHFGSHME